MRKRSSKSRPTWVDVKDKLAGFDRAGLLRLVQDLYAAHKDNQEFLHARLGLSEDVLKTYEEKIERWLFPDVLRNQNPSVTQAKQAISNYQKAVGEPAGLAELMVFYCEQASEFARAFGYDDESYLNALVRMFEQGYALVLKLPADRRAPLLARLDEVGNICRGIGYGVGDYIADVLARSS